MPQQKTHFFDNKKYLHVINDNIRILIKAICILYFADKLETINNAKTTAYGFFHKAKTVSADDANYY